jgi:uracil-DNA glycosylase
MKSLEEKFESLPPERQERIKARTEELKREMKPSWGQLRFFKEQFPAIKNFLKEEKEKGKTILPLSVGHYFNWFNAFLKTPRDKVKVVIIGQDPYPNKKHAMGLAFSVPEDTHPIPPSLQNIIKELYDDVGVDRKWPLLTDWAKQGVLLLNASLTVEEGKPNSHAYIGWHELAKEVIETVSSEQEGVVFVMWGNYAQNYARFIKNYDKHMVLMSSHPSPLSANRGFFGSKPFSKINFYLESVGKSPIRW